MDRSNLALGHVLRRGLLVSAWYRVALIPSESRRRARATWVAAGNGRRRVKINVGTTFKATNRCGQCHVGGGQTPQFVRQDDVNLAYEAANTVVTLSSPEDSMMVTKVAGGHNCWLASNDACGEILTTWITNWAGDIAAGGGSVVLEAPPLHDPGASKSFPTGAEGSALYASTVYPIVEEYCQRCHAPSAANAQSPYFASEDIPEAYDAAKTKMNLDQPAMSRLVVRSKGSTTAGAIARPTPTRCRRRSRPSPTRLN
jgi:mono/diheme cytochrome c family protein